jgi:hypothetical protein
VREQRLRAAQSADGVHGFPAPWSLPLMGFAMTLVNNLNVNQFFENQSEEGKKCFLTENTTKGPLSHFFAGSQ